jgi:NhaP-type Na+/H+ or K+/H+ antiporter
MSQMRSNFQFQLEAALEDQRKDFASEARDSIIRGVVFGLLLGLFFGYLVFH